MSSSGSIDIISTVKNIHEKLWKYRYCITVKNILEKLWKYGYALKNNG